MLFLLAALSTSSPALAANGPDSAACKAAISKAAEGAALAAGDVKGLDGACLSLLALTPKARHGMKFREDGPRDFFAAQPWYAPIPAFNEAQMAAVDHDNVALATQAGEDIGVAEALAANEVFALGAGCPTPAPGPVTALCVDGRRGTARLNGVNITDGPSGPVWEIDMTNISGGVDASVQGCVLIPGHHGAREAGGPADPAFQAALEAMCSGRGRSCQALAGDLNADGVSDGLLYVQGQGRAGALATELYRADGNGAPVQAAQLCNFGG